MTSAERPEDGARSLGSSSVGEAIIGYALLFAVFGFFAAIIAGEVKATKGRPSGSRLAIQIGESSPIEIFPPISSPGVSAVTEEGNRR